MDLYSPPIITTEMMLGIFRRVPATRIPPAIKDEQLAAFRALQRQ